MKTALQYKTAAKVVWMWDGGSPEINHAFPGHKISFDSLCGEHFGGLNGKFRKQHCTECKSLVPAYLANIRKDEKKRWEKWLESKKRTEMLDIIAEEISTMDASGLAFIIVRTKAIRLNKCEMTLNLPK